MRKEVWNQQKNHEKRLNKKEIARKIRFPGAVSAEGCVGGSRRRGVVLAVVPG